MRPAHVDSSAVSFNLTADTLAAGIPPWPVIGIASVPWAATGLAGPPMPTLVSSSRAGGSETNGPTGTLSCALVAGRSAGRPEATVGSKPQPRTAVMTSNTATRRAINGEPTPEYSPQRQCSTYRVTTALRDFPTTQTAATVRATAG